ncbi:MAG TPA: crossover junction endodeoxyribonuclease RuvC, partial [Acidimicrobiia bacterium]
TGDGAADKAAVQMMVTKLLDLPRAPQPPDAADALALALCHSWRARVDAEDRSVGHRSVGHLAVGRRLVEHGFDPRGPAPLPGGPPLMPPPPNPSWSDVRLAWDARAVAGTSS